MEDHTMPFFPVELELGSTAFFVAPGGNITVVFALTNRTGREDYFDIAINGIPSEWVLLDLPVIYLESDERREARLEIRPPVGAEGAYPVALRAASQTDPELAGEARFDVRVAEREVGADTVVGAAVAGIQDHGTPNPSTRIGVFMDLLQFNVIPGGSASIPLMLVNQGRSEDTFHITVEGVPPTWVSMPTPAVHLQPGEQREVLFYVQPPQTPASRAGRYTINVRIASQLEPGHVMAVDTVLTVAAYSQFTSDFSPRRLDAGKTARLRIHNLGNIPGSYTVRWEDRGNLLDYVPSISGPVAVQPGETAAVDFAVSPRTPNWIGRPVDQPYRVMVQSSEGEVQFHNGEVVSRALIPVWVLPAFLTLCLTLLCIGGFLWNWNQTRLAGLRNTQEAQRDLVVAITQTVEYQQTALAIGLLQTPSLPPIDPTPTFPLAPTGTEAPLPSETPIPTLTILPTLSPIPLTDTPQPTNTPVPPTLAPPTPTNTIVVTETLDPGPPLVTSTVQVPVTGPGSVIFQSDRDGVLDLYVYETGSGEFRRLFEEGGPNAQPAWSPDGARVAFTSARDGNNEIYVANADGSNPVNLTNNPASDSDPYWSADGRFIVFSSDRDGNLEIYVMNADGSNPVNLTNDPADDVQPVWHIQRGLLSSTNHILFTSNRDGNNEIYRMNADGSEPVNLTNHPASDVMPAVEWEGGPVLFVSDRDGNLEVYRMQADGSEPANLTNHPAEDLSPDWSPDGERVVFVSNRDGNYDILVIGPDGADPINLTNSPTQENAPRWR